MYLHFFLDINGILSCTDVETVIQEHHDTICQRFGKFIGVLKRDVSSPISVFDIHPTQHYSMVEVLPP